MVLETDLVDMDEISVGSFMIILNFGCVLLILAGPWIETRLHKDDVNWNNRSKLLQRSASGNITAVRDSMLAQRRSSDRAKRMVATPPPGAPAEEGGGRSRALELPNLLADNPIVRSASSITDEDDI